MSGGRIGKIKSRLPNQLFRVALDFGEEVIAHLGDEYKMEYIRLLPGDRVRVEQAENDPSRGRIVGMAP